MMSVEGGEKYYEHKRRRCYTNEKESSLRL